MSEQQRKQQAADKVITAWQRLEDRLYKDKTVWPPTLRDLNITDGEQVFDWVSPETGEAFKSWVRSAKRYDKLLWSGDVAGTEPCVLRRDIVDDMTPALNDVNKILGILSCTVRVEDDYGLWAFFLDMRIGFILTSDAAGVPVENRGA